MIGCISAFDWGFNRYMVECECGSIAISKSYSKRFNRYMVECEFFRTKTGRKCNSVLIDTWWNVNKELADNLLFTFSF